ncbi:MAG: hypothetical protein Q7T30_00985 [Planctomycetota bacterium]|nr:hypothetical protein [Planctomycetota bacterium]
MHPIPATLLCSLLLTVGTAQMPWKELGRVGRNGAVPTGEVVFHFAAERLPDVPCPFANPRLSAADPAEVAWAAHHLLAADSIEPTTVEALVAALRTMRAGTTEEHQRAVLHLLHAALEQHLVLPIAELQNPPEGRARIPWIALQARAAVKEGGDLFALFHRLDEQPDAAWEVLGNSLAIRDHGAFALEMRTRMEPRLRVYASRHPSGDSGPRPIEELPPRIEGFPLPPIHNWARDRLGVLGATHTYARQLHDVEEPLDEVEIDRARLRWLAEMAGEPAPVAWAGRFDVQWKSRDMAKFVTFADAAEARARAALDRADAAFRTRFRVPERRHFPGLVVEWVDGRSEADRKAMPMPVQKQ